MSVYDCEMEEHRERRVKYHPQPLIARVILRIVADRDSLRAENDELKKRLSVATSDIIYLSDALGE